jgi:hypothetical protein
VRLSVEVADDLDGVGADELFDLDRNLGAAGCLGRLVQHSADPRWVPRYVIVRDGPLLLAMVPIFLGVGKQWSDQIHSPQRWGHVEPALPANSALIGGRLEIRGSLCCADEPEVIRMVADGCASINELRGRDLFFGYLDEHQQALAEAVFGPVKWLAEYEDFVYPDEVVQGPLASLPRNVRQTIRHSERQVAEHQISVQTSLWTEYHGNACDLIADHNIRKGVVDHPALVRYRMEQWNDCEEVTALVVHAVADGMDGAVTLLLYRDEMEVYEIGLPGQEDVRRRALYACLTFHEPRRVARSRALTKIRAGLGAARPKQLRGARAVVRKCGVSLRSLP